MAPSRREVLKWLAGGLTAAAVSLPAAPLQAKKSDKKVTSNLFKPFVVSLFVEEEDDFVDFVGLAHVVVQACLSDSAAPVDPCHFHANLQHVVGTGPSGDEYRLDGAFNLQAAIVAGGEYQFTGLFRLTPVDPCRRTSPTDPCQRNVSLRFDVAVNDDATVDQEGVSVAPAPPIIID
jgi:hypothetical protein